MNKMILTLLAIFVATLSISFTGCQTPGKGEDSGVRQMVINHGAKVALTATVKAIVNNNPDYKPALVATSSVLNELSWAKESPMPEDIKEALREEYQARGIPEEHQDKIVMALSSGLGIYQEFMVANNYERVGQNSVLSALSSGIDMGLMADTLFEDTSQPSEPNPFTLQQ